MLTPLKGNKIKWYIIKLWNTPFILCSHWPCWQELLRTGAQANGATTSSPGSPYQSYAPPGQWLQTLLVAAASRLRCGGFLTLSLFSLVVSYQEPLELIATRGSTIRSTAANEIDFSGKIFFCLVLRKPLSGDAGGCTSVRWTHYPRGWGNLPKGNEPQCLI